MEKGPLRTGISLAAICAACRYLQRLWSLPPLCCATRGILVCQGSQFWTPVLEAQGAKVPQPGTTDLQSTAGDARQLSDTHRCHDSVRQDSI